MGGQKKLAAGSYLQMARAMMREYAALNATMKAAGKEYPSLRVRQVEPFVDYWESQIERRFPDPPDTANWEALEKGAVKPFSAVWDPFVTAAKAMEAAQGTEVTSEEETPPGSMPDLWRATLKLAAALDSSVPGDSRPIWDKRDLLQKVPQPFTLTWWGDERRKKKKKKQGWGIGILLLLFIWASE